MTDISPPREADIQGATGVGNARDAMLAVSRLLSVQGDHEAPGTVRERLVAEARTFFSARRVVLVAPRGGGELRVEAASPSRRMPNGDLPLGDFTVLRDPTERGEVAVVTGDEAARLDAALGSLDPSRSLLALPLATGRDAHDALVIAADGEEHFSPEEIDLAAAFASAAAASLSNLRMARDHASQVAQQRALARAAKSLNESLDLNRVLVRICHESAAILDADLAVVYRGSREAGVTVEATYGLPPEAIGYELEPGQGLAGKAAESDMSLMTSDYGALAAATDTALFGEVRACLAVPMHWEGELRGVLSVGWRSEHEVGHDELALLEAFGELAAAASRNAAAHAGLVLAARTDGLTGCLNHAAMHEALRREIQRSERTGHRLSLVLVDLDDFKQVNETHGHLVGDEVLRRVGQALRQAVRPYDLVARYGGDEFALLAVDADEGEAREVAERALDGVRRSLAELSVAPSATGASAGVAEWSPGETPTALIERADHALLFGKHDGGRGRVSGGEELPEDYRPSAAPATPKPEVAAVEPSPAGGAWPDTMREQTERLRTRTRQLSLANALGTRLAVMTDPEQIVEAAVDELHRAFGFTACAVVAVRGDGYVETVAGRGESPGAVQDGRSYAPREAGVVGRALREREPVIESRAAAGSDDTALTEVAVPIWSGETLWGALHIEEAQAEAFDADDGRLAQTLADQVGAALRSALLYRRLDQAYEGTARALAGALEVNDSYTSAHANAVVGSSERVGRRLGLDDEQLRTLRFAAIFHDIGKIAVQQETLAKSEPLTAAEREAIEGHTVVAERILASVDFLAEVLPLIRHEHERWDGRGYPDGLAGESIPLGARIVLACDAYDAMVSDRPYRPALTDAQARQELRAGAGSQFDERVVSALIAVLDERPGQPAANASR